MREKTSPSVMGGSALLVIFAVLCMVMFALLSLTAVQSDRRIENAADNAVTDYYAADAQAEKILAQIRAGEPPSDVAVNEDRYSYSVTISNTQKLNVEVRVEGDSFTVLNWKAVSTVQWVPDNSLNVWDGKSGS